MEFCELRMLGVLGNSALQAPHRRPRMGRLRHRQPVLDTRRPARIKLLLNRYRMLPNWSRDDRINHAYHVVPVLRDEPEANAVSDEAVQGALIFPFIEPQVPAVLTIGKEGGSDSPRTGRAQGAFRRRSHGRLSSPGEERGPCLAPADRRGQQGGTKGTTYRMRRRY